MGKGSEYKVKEAFNFILKSKYTIKKNRKIKKELLVFTVSRSGTLNYFF